MDFMRNVQAGWAKKGFMGKSASELFEYGLGNDLGSSHQFLVLTT